MIQVADAADIARLEDALLRLCPSRQWQVKTVTFPSVANTDIDIVHTLTPANPELIRYQVIQAASPLVVYHNTGAARTAWLPGVIRLRCTQASGKVTLLLWVADATAVEQLGPIDTYNTLAQQLFSVGEGGTTNFQAGIGNLGGVGVGGAGFYSAYGALSNTWAIFAASPALFSGGGSGLAFTDVPNQNAATVGMGLYRGSAINALPAEYYLVPAGSTSHLNIGAPTSSSTRVYDVNASGTVDALGGFKERFRTVAAGERNAPSFSAGVFTASTGNWTVASGDQVAYEWTVSGLAYTLTVMVATSTTDAAPAYLKVAIPGGGTIVGNAVTPCMCFHGGAWNVGFMQAISGESFIRVYATAAATAWPTETDTIWVRGQITFFATA